MEKPQRAEIHSVPDPPHQPSLRGIDESTGEIRSVKEQALLTEIKDLRHQLAGMETDLRAWRGRYGALKADKEKAARKQVLWPVGERLFGLWLRATGKVDPQGKQVHGGQLPVFDYERFELIKRFLKDATHDFEEAEGPPANDFENAAAAIIGRVGDHFVGARANGTKVHYHEFDRIFKSRKEYDDSAARRPRNWRELAQRFDPGEQSTRPRAVPDA